MKRMTAEEARRNFADLLNEVGFQGSQVLITRHGKPLARLVPAIGESPQVHASDCPLDSVHWLRHATAAAGRLANETPEAHTDRISAMALADAIAHFAELGNWATVTLRDIAEHATLMKRDRFRGLCTCGGLD
ncbi:type II toxin-antitoxin system Phd/YefM family antitoxin [Streptomyces sp. NBC_00690]|uniref:type II toxin-antitoxin system Phd/YefM family antitoxin n=1 Tax=Streptomyces sp. NBC_00690 TaxID=2975808 RepID=UPI002E2B3679|nr:type II toxin-antitoxin system Phd/YefM family antitoxin [Streptomyces sp. NBC_00690]